MPNPSPAEFQALGVIQQALGATGLAARLEFDAAMGRFVLVVPSLPLVMSHVTLEPGPQFMGVPVVGLAATKRSIPTRVPAATPTRVPVVVPPPPIPPTSLAASPGRGQLGLAIEALRREKAKCGVIRGIFPGMVGGKPAIRVEVAGDPAAARISCALPPTFLGFSVLVEAA